MSSIVIVAVPVAVIAALRGVWSPCGLSMLSSITPMTEAGRGHTFRGTATWFTVGGLLGGLSAGVLAAAVAVVLRAADLGAGTLLGIGSLLACLTAAIDLGFTPVDLPIFKRQVNDAWLRRYRSWVYGAGFGWQIGFGVATYIMTAAVFCTLGLAALTASPAAAVAIGAVFGLTRGAAVWIGAPATTPAALARVHARLDAWAPISRAAAAWVQVGAAVVLGALAWGPVAPLVIAAALIVGLIVRGQARIATRAGA